VAKAANRRREAAVAAKVNTKTVRANRAAIEVVAAEIAGAAAVATADHAAVKAAADMKTAAGIAEYFEAWNRISIGAGRLGSSLRAPSVLPHH
jgi:hypothetical protein